jgi:hypothetical protein
LDSWSQTSAGRLEGLPGSLVQRVLKHAKALGLKCSGEAPYLFFDKVRTIFVLLYVDDFLILNIFKQAGARVELREDHEGAVLEVRAQGAAARELVSGDSDPDSAVMIRPDVAFAASELSKSYPAHSGS